MLGCRIATRHPTYRNVLNDGVMLHHQESVFMCAQLSPHLNIAIELIHKSTQVVVENSFKSSQGPNCSKRKFYLKMDKDKDLEKMTLRMN